MWKCHNKTPCIAILNKQKCHCFSFTKLENRRMEQILSGGVDTSGRGEKVGKGCGRVNIVQILCTHVILYQKMRSVDETIPGVGGEGIKENGRVYIMYDTFDI
jgi:hypothetical protein